jgi:hypothetical protein
MAIRLQKPWQAIASAHQLPAQLGVFELADAAGAILCVGYAGGRSQFGLRGAVQAAAASVAGADSFRVEVNTAYLTRYRELLMVYVADHGALPPANSPEPALGRLSPA